MRGCVVLSGGDDVSDSFARSMANMLSSPYLAITRKIFPDGESYVRIPSQALEADRICVVKTLDRPQDKSFLELLLILDTLSSKGVKEIVAVVPYLAYARQDREFLENEAVSVRTVLRAIRGAGASALYAIEVHKEESLRYFGGPAKSVSPFEYMADFIDIGENTVVIAPDLGARDRARRLASKLGVDYDYLVKVRDRITGEVSYKPKELNVEGSHVVLVDDIISTGGTVAKASRILLERGARTVTVVVAHALLVDGAWRKLRDAGVSRVYAANTVKPAEGDPVIIDVAPLVARELA
ncbi:MAG: ribose-phosphate diphosphokinase [Desulfurococcales archaeon]|nr:ribose-phosphate diphosphokinase [Desulfurococcales archaeon]